MVLPISLAQCTVLHVGFERRLDVECGRWCSSDCIVDSDVCYDRDASNVITDQNSAWAKFHGFYEVSASANNADGMVLEEPFLPSRDQTFYPN